VGPLHFLLCFLHLFSVDLVNEALSHEEEVVVDCRHESVIGQELRFILKLVQANVHCQPH
jgi:hypothetical protein